MDKLWAPWRINYIKKAPKQKQCIFCLAKKITSRAKIKQKDKKNLVLFRGKHCFAMLNLFPYNNGHILISPYRHLSNIAALTDAEILDLFKTISLMTRVLDKIIKPQAYNIGLNAGKTAGAGIPGHIHLHIVPRWQADTNFITVISNTRVISQSLEELHKLISRELSILLGKANGNYGIASQQ